MKEPKEKLIQHIFDIGVDQKELLKELGKLSNKSVAKLIRESISFYLGGTHQPTIEKAIDIIDYKIQTLNSLGDGEMIKTVVEHLEQVRKSLLKQIGL